MKDEKGGWSRGEDKPKWFESSEVEVKGLVDIRSHDSNVVEAHDEDDCDGKRRL